MPNATTSAVVVALSAIAVLVLLNALRKTITGSEWDSTALLGALSVALFSSVYVILTYTDSWDQVTKQNQELEIKPQWGNYLITALGGVLVVVSAVIFFRAVRRNKFVNIYNPAAVLTLVLAVVSVVSTVLNGDNPVRPATGLMLAVLVACTVAPRGLGVHVGIGSVCVIVAIASGFAIVLHKDFSVMPCPWDKCGILGFQFRGVFHHQNTLAIFLTLALPFVYVGFASWEGPVLSAYILGLVLLSGSRSCTAAAVLTFVVLMLARPNIRRRARTLTQPVLLYLVLAVAFGAGLVLPFVVKDPNFLTGRGHLWMLAREQISHPATLVHGKGALGWQHVADAGLIHISAGYSVHNQWLQVLYSTGVLGLVIFLVVLLVLIWRAGRAYGLVIGCVLLPVFLLGVTERPWPVDSADWVMWVVPGALLSYPLVKRLSGDEIVDGPHGAEEPIARSPARGRHRAPRRSRWRQPSRSEAAR